jgi:hypothetical protein
MSMTSNGNRETRDAPLPADDDSSEVSQPEPDVERLATSPDTTTVPRIKNN